MVEHRHNSRTTGYLLLSLVVFLIAWGSSHRASAQPAPTTQWLRFIAGAEQWQGQLQTAITSYENFDGVRVDLVAAVHIADKEYYAHLNEYFATVDSVLFELVAEKNVRPVQAVDGARDGSIDRTVEDVSAMSFIQTSLANFLGVAFQLEEIDYSPSNFIHADLSPAELREIMLSKNENFFSMFLSLALAQIAAEQSSRADLSPNSTLSLITLMGALRAEDQTAALKFLFAQELGRSGGLMIDPGLQSQITLLGDRNREALRVLQEVLLEAQDDPDQATISIFYGAAHMPGIENELRQALGFELIGQRWLNAWQMSPMSVD